jgi:hypothetical protein
MQQICITYNLLPILPRETLPSWYTTLLIITHISVIADLYSYTIPACAVEAPDDG